MSNDFRAELERLGKLIGETKQVMKNAGVELTNEGALLVIIHRDMAAHGERVLKNLASIDGELKTLKHAISGTPQLFKK